MTTDTLPATLGFLTDAAHLLVAGSPATSAFLMSQRNLLMFNTQLEQPDVQRQRVCGCCGRIMIFGQGDVFKIDSTKAARKPTRRKRCSNAKDNSKDKTKDKSNTAVPKSGCQKTLTCGNCGRYTKINLPRSARIPQRRLKQTGKPIAKPTTSVSSIPGKVMTSAQAPSPLSSKLGSTPGITTYVEPAKVSANASSKKRAKNRKQGLQALLQQSSNAKSQSGLGLSLADFMQN